MGFQGNKPALSSADSYDIDRARGLWTSSAQLLAD
jgi:hypothetical protein